MSAEAKLEIILEALDKASDVISGAAGKIRGEMDGVAQANERVDTAQKKVDGSAKDVAVGLSGVATSAFALYLSFDRLEKSQYMVEKANLAVQRATESAENAQSAYNTAVGRYGEGSDQAQQASDKLRIANEAVSLAADRARLVQNDLNNAMIQTAMAVIPALITGFAGVAKAAEGLSDVGEKISKALSFLQANPILLVITAVVALGAAVYGMVSSWSAAAEEQARVNKLLRESNDLTQQSATSWEGVDAGVRALTANLKALQEKQTELNKAMTDNVSTLDNLRAAGENSRRADSARGDVIQQNINAGRTQIQVINDAIEADQRMLEQYQREMRVRDLWASTVVTQSEAYKSAISDLADSIQANIGNMALMTPEQADAQAALIQGLVDKFGISWDQAYADVKASMDASRTAMSNLTTNLETEWNKQQAAASQALPAIARWFSDAFSEGRFGDAARLVESFATQFGITFDVAEGIIEDFKEKTKEIPQTIEQQLVGKAQADFENFKNCISGKARTLGTDVQGTMQQMSDQIVNLINSGLVGEAQNEMAAYVNCSTSKVSDMVLTINGYMTDLTTQHNKKMNDLTEAAKTAMGAQKDAILAAMGLEISGYEAQMSAFHAWQQALYGQLLKDASSLQAGINAIMQSASNALASVKGDFKQAQQILWDVWEVTKSAKVVAALAAEYGKAAAGAAPPVVENPAVTGPETPPSEPYYPPSIKGPSGSGPTMAEAGEPYVTVPASRPTVTVQFNAPVIQVQGSADMATVNKAVTVMTAKLKNVLVEASSSAAPTTSKIIRPRAA
jgi:hypothetical protein